MEKIIVYRIVHLDYSSDYSVVGSTEYDYWPKITTGNLISARELLNKFFVKEDIDYLHEIDPDFVEKVVGELQEELISSAIVEIEKIENVKRKEEIPPNYKRGQCCSKVGDKYLPSDQASKIVNKYKKMLDNHNFKKEKKLSEEEEKQLLRKLFGG